VKGKEEVKKKRSQLDKDKETKKLKKERHKGYEKEKK